MLFAQLIFARFSRRHACLRHVTAAMLPFSPDGHAAAEAAAISPPPGAVRRCHNADEERRRPPDAAAASLRRRQPMRVRDVRAARRPPPPPDMVCDFNAADMRAQRVDAERRCSSDTAARCAAAERCRGLRLPCAQRMPRCAVRASRGRRCRRRRDVLRASRAPVPACRRHNATMRRMPQPRAHALAVATPPWRRRFSFCRYVEDTIRHTPAATCHAA